MITSLKYNCFLLNLKDRLILNLKPQVIYGIVSGFYEQLIFHQIFNIFFYGILILVLLHTILYLSMALVACFRRDHETPLLDNGFEPFVTIQIPTRNELAAIQCAKCCFNFDYPKNKMQIIIGDDSDDTHVQTELDKFAAKNPDIITISRRGNNIGFKSGNLNAIMPLSKGKYIAVFDSDFLPQPNFLRKMLYPLENDSSLILTQARWKIHNLDQNLYSLLGGTISFFTHYAAYPFLKAIGANSYIGGSGYVIRKSAIEEIGGWREGSLTEDAEASLELIKRGKKMLYLEDVIVECEAPFTLEDTYKQQKRWAFGNVSVFRRNCMAVWKSKKTKLIDKISVLIFVSGYIYPFLLALLIIFGFLQLIIPNPYLPPLPLILIFLNLLIVFLLSQISFFTSSLVLFRNKKKHLIPKLILSTFLYGGTILYHVNIGTLKALFGKRMKWYLLEKNANKLN